MKKVLFFIGLGIILVVGAAVATLFISGRAVLVMKEPAETVYTFRKVCSDETNKQFAEKFQYGQVLKDPINDFVKDIKNQDGWELDANCVHIMLQAAIANADMETTKSLAAKKNQLTEQGLYPDLGVSRVGVSSDHAEEAAEQRKLENSTKPEEGIQTGPIGI